MDHKEAIRIDAVDRYLLGELSPEERREFEEHFFSCGECSEDLHMGTILVEGSRDILREESVDPIRTSPGAASRRPGWFQWWSPVPVAATVVLLAVVGYQNLRVLPEYRREAAESAGATALAHFDLRPAARDGAPVITVPKGARFFEVEAQEVEPAVGGYDCTIQDARENVRAKLHADSIRAGEKLNLLLDAHKIGPGPYILVVRKSSDGAELGQYPFSVQLN